MYHKTTGYRIFTWVNNSLLALLAFVCLLPLIHVLAVSFSGKEAAGANLVNLWPVDFTTVAYQQTLQNNNFAHAMLVSFTRVLLGTGIGMLLCILAAYPLSKGAEVLRGRTALSFYFLFTMLFNGGLIPTYILVSNLHIMNSIWALILPSALNVWNIILMMNFFRNVPKELEEASLIDGANHLRTLVSVYLPISLPSLATIALFTIVYHWNSWFEGLIYINSQDDYPLATLLQTIIVQPDLSKLNGNVNALKEYSQRTVKAAQIFIAALPILLIYPFLQRFFVKGIVLGAVKS
ncbi:carbohydrate ABC transporter permease [Paenibacillus sp. GCM10023252]|uniref:carbohydrate ABC transporter permease n=1 Tax=Paenibacillus sp. GCM10023252 TaxID=3252649 RepID=UPI0036132AA4